MTTSPARQPFAHDAVLAMAATEDDRAPGGAITVALCGGWEHEPPCPLAPHSTRAVRDGDRVRLRVLFAARPEDEARVRTTIEDALGRGVGETPDGGRATWRLLGAGASAVRPGETEHAARIAAS